MLLSLDIGYRYMYIVEGKTTSNGNIVRVNKAVTAKVPDNTFVNGNITNVQNLGKYIRTILKQNKISTKKAVITVGGTKPIFREIIVPKPKKEEQLPFLVDNLMTQQIASAEDYVFDFTVMEELLGEDNAVNVKVMAIAMQKEHVKMYRELLRAAALTPLALDVNSNAVEKLFAHTQVNESKTYETTAVLIDIGYTSANLYLLQMGKLTYARCVPISINDSLKTLVNLGRLDNLDNWVSKVNVAPEELKEDPLAVNALLPYLNALSDELQKMVQFQLTRSPQNKVRSVLLYGPVAELKGIEAYMQNSLGIKTEIIKKLTNVVFPHSYSLIGYVNALGAQIRLRGAVK